MIGACKYCGDTIYETESSVGFNDKLVWMRGRYRHTDGDRLTCLADKIDRTRIGFENPKCVVCKTETDAHDAHCSFINAPKFCAEPI